MINKKRISSFFIASGTVAVVASLLPVVLVNNSNNFLFSNNLNSDTNSSVNDDSKTDKVNQLQPIDFNDSWPLLSTDSGPITSNKNIISALDWFASTRWTLNVMDIEWNGKKIFDSNKKFVHWTDRAFINWDLDRKNNILWLLTNSQMNTETNVLKQKIIQIDVTNGKILLVKDLNFNPNINNGHQAQYNLYYSITALNSGKVMVYSQGTPIWTQFDIYDPKTDSVITLNSKTTNMVEPIEKDLAQQKTKGDVRVRFFFPVANNMNILVLTNYGWNDQPQYNNYNFGDLWIVLVDDNMNRIGTKNAVQIVERDQMGELNSEGDTFPKLYYTLADGRVLFTAFNKIFVFFTNDIVSKKELVYKELDYGIKEGDKYKSVESWTTDTDNNVYVKFSNDDKIYRVKVIGNSFENTTFKQDTYYNVSGSSIEKIKKYSKNFVIYNVYGYSGQIMMLNPRKVTEKTKIEEIDKENVNDYGLAAAIVQNKNEDGGDSKGLLNTAEAFIKSSDFDINENILKNKLPSEISRTDLTITEGGFLTQNSTKDPITGQLKYKQFVKTNIDDKGKKFTITANIDQIPWFVNNGVMPSNIPPLTITKNFDTTNSIDSRVTWKDASLDYDFKNTIPSKVTLDDVKRFNPFDINLTSQNTSVAGSNYPSKEYKVENTNDTDGTITIKATIKYLPIDVEAKVENVVTQEFTHKYQIFKKTDEKDFNFIGNKNDSSEENIKDIPQLKELSESNLLPSSFNAQDTASILKFVNTDTSKGYPLSKMKFSITTNDINGTLTISGKLEDGYYEDGNSNKEFKKTYIGLNKISDYRFNVNISPSGFNKKDYLPSEIDEQIIYKSFATYQGFNSSDIKLDLIPNDSTGELIAKFYLDGSYPASVANEVGFTKSDNSYYKEFSIQGFKTISEYEEQYSIKFKEDNSKDFDQIKKYTPNQIKQILTAAKKEENNQLYIGSQKINNEMDLAKNVIEKYGSKIPTDLNESNFEYNIYYNDPNGEITVKLVFKNVSGLSNQLVFIQRFTGFAKGNQVPTGDILSFKTETKLFVDNPEFKTMLPSEIKKSLDEKNTRKNMIDKFLSFYSGDYKKLIEENTFTLDVVADDIFGYITIKISFDKTQVTNQDSLLSYTATFNGFKTE